MRAALISTCVLFWAVQALAQPKENIFKHLSWSAEGTHHGQHLGVNGLDTIGYLNDTIRHAIAVGSDGRSKLIYNRFPGDTTTQYWFPGEKVIRGNINGDAFPDFVVANTDDRKITVLFGTQDIARFDTALVLQGDENANQFGQVSIVVTRCDSDHYDDIVISDLLYQDSHGRTMGRILYYRGGTQLDSTPTEQVQGTAGHDIGGDFAVGCLRDTSQRYLAQARLYYNVDTSIVILRPLGFPEFHLESHDTIVLRTTSGGAITGGFTMGDMEGSDNVDDIAVGTMSRVLLYKGGTNILSAPTFTINRPFPTGSTTFGAKIVDLGDITGRGYHTIAVTDPDASVGNDGYFNGAVFLYNIGKALKDSCVAFGGGGYTDGHFGTQVIPLGDVTGDGRCEFMISGDAETFTVPTITHIGELYVFTGDTSFGPTVGVRETGAVAADLSLGENFPNPFSTSTTVVFDVTLPGNAVLTIYDAVGRVVARPLASHMRAGRYAVGIDAGVLPDGVYRYELACGNVRMSRSMIVAR